MNYLMITHLLGGVGLILQFKAHTRNIKKAILFAGSFEILSVDQMVGFLEYADTLKI